VDNVTHSVAGLLIAEVAVQLRQARAGRAPSPGFRLAAAAAGVVGANLPDADLLYTSLAAGRFAYLLHHRGYTHTVAAALPGVALVWALGVWLARRRGGGAPGDAPWLLAVAAAAVASHLALDWTNNYGVHPFWPVRNAWYYGDAVFIVEPWLWVVAVPALALAARWRASRALLLAVLGAGLALAWLVGVVPRAGALALTGGAVLALALASRLAPLARVTAAIAAWLLVEGVFFASTRAARAQLAGPGVVDAIVTPVPAFPPCATALVVSTAGTGAEARYALTTATVAAWPALVGVARCGRGDGRGGARSLAMRPSPRPATAAVRWELTWDAPLAELTALARTNCQVAALLRFMRAPFWFRDDATTLRVGDLRYDREPGLGFAELRVPDRPAACPQGVPPWRPPRADLLDPAT
jgi:inner membrane protein